MAHELIDAVSDERIEAAVDRTLHLRARQGGMPLGSLAWAAVEETFCTCVTGAEDAVEHRLSAIHAALVADVLRRAERRLGEPSQTGAGTLGGQPGAPSDGAGGDHGVQRAARWRRLPLAVPPPSGSQHG